MTRKLHPDNNSRLRIRAPAIVDAAMYLDGFLAAGQVVVVTLRVGEREFDGPTFVHAVEELRKWFWNRQIDTAATAKNRCKRNGENSPTNSSGGNSATRNAKQSSVKKTQAKKS